MRRTAALALLGFLAALAPAPRADADAVSLEAALTLGLVAVQDASRLLLEKNRQGAVDSLDLAVSLGEDAVADAADSVTRADLGVLASKAAKKAAAFLKATQKARDAMANPNLSELAAVKVAGKASKAGYAVLGILRKSPFKGAGVAEVKPNSAGFHNPGEYVELRIYPGLDSGGLPCLEAPAIAVIDPFGNGSVVEGYDVLDSYPDGSFDIGVGMGDNGGPARVAVTACGVTRNWLLFNYGPTGTFAAQPEVERYDGAYTGSFSGTATDHGFSVPVDGPVAITVSGGVINVVDPGAGVGNLSAKGSAGFAGSGGAYSADYTFSGKFTATALGTGPGTAIASGSWTATYPGGTAHGHWSAAR